MRGRLVQNNASSLRLNRGKASSLHYLRKGLFGFFITVVVLAAICLMLPTLLGIIDIGALYAEEFDLPRWYILLAILSPLILWTIAETLDERLNLRHQDPMRPRIVAGIAKFVLSMLSTLGIAAIVLEVWTLVIAGLLYEGLPTGIQALGFGRPNLITNPTTAIIIGCIVGMPFALRTIWSYGPFLCLRRKVAITLLSA
jgi:hypothetical protein